MGLIVVFAALLLFSILLSVFSVRTAQALPEKGE